MFRQVMPFGMLSTLCVLLGLGCLDGKKVNGAENDKVADFAAMGLKEGRERLRSGVFTARGRMVVTSQADVREVPIDIFSAFDKARSVLRFDRQDTGLGRNSLLNMPSRLIVSNTETLFWVEGARAVMQSRGADERLLRKARPFEIGVIGLATWGELSGFAEFEATWKPILGAIPKMQVKREGPKYVLEWENTSAGIRRAVWLDPAADYGPIRQEIWTLAPEGATPTLLEVSEVAWRKQADVSVPDSFVVEEHYNAPKETRLELAFDWHQVNEPIRDELFTAEGLKVPSGTYLVSLEKKKPIIVRRFGETEPTTVYDGFEPVRMTIIIVVGAAVALLVIKLLRNWLLRARSTNA